MPAISEAFLNRARACLAGAASQFGYGRYNNAANGCYYACY